MRKVRAKGFTLVELLVVIGIIAVLISVLLPALGKARESASTIKCASNLRNVGAGLGIYLTENRQTYPASYIYAGMKVVGTIGADGTQTPNAAVDGYIHWSSYLYGQKDKRGDKNIYRSNVGWDVFQCPSINNGGLPPTNTYSGNLEGGQINDNGANVIDEQAPRCAFTLNEAICPRNKFVRGFVSGSETTARPYVFVRAAQVKKSAETILATEYNQDWKIVQDAGNAGTDFACKSHRPVHGFVDLGGGNYKIETIPPDAFRNRPTFRRQSLDSAFPGGPTGDPQPGTKNPLDWVGRNHGRKVLKNGWDQRRTNFLYVDGHVETKNLRETLSPFQWGERFYSLSANGDMAEQP